MPRKRRNTGKPRLAAASGKAQAAPSMPEAGAAWPFAIAGIGASAGGLEALKQMLEALPADTGMAFVAILHLAPHQTSMLTHILSRETRMPVVEASEALEVKPDHLYVIKPGMDLVINDGKLVSHPRVDSPGFHRPIDTFLNSLAEAQGHRSVAVVLSGGASDGTLGLEAVKAAGGLTFAQDATAQYESMPRSAIASGSVDFVLPPDAIAREIARIAEDPYLKAPDTGAEIEPSFDFMPVLDLLREHSGVDFSQYKRSTLLRRIQRRMTLLQIDSVSEYTQVLKDRASELEALYQDFLIHVTSFFRDPDTSAVLKSEVFRRFLKNRSSQDPVRFWIVGCATGEEAYSMAIAFSEYLEDTGQQCEFHVFATDLNHACIEKARAGFYPESATGNLSPERLQRYFVRADGGYRIRSSIRDMCTFARHNVLSDPPFSRIDLVACCNVLIYLGRELQQRVISTFHYALRPGGVLVVGRSETIGSQRNLFELEHPRHKIYIKQPSRTPIPITTGFPPTAGGTPSRAHNREVKPSPSDLQKQTERLLLSRYAPPGIVLDADFQILHVHGDTGAYLAPAPGRASFNALRMLREGLLPGVRAALLKAKRDGKVVRRNGLQVRSNGGYREVSVEVQPIRGPGREEAFLLLFEEPSTLQREATRKGAGRRDAARRPEAADSSERLRLELDASRDYLQTVIEQFEAANEELQSSNEEVQSSNEELQSVNEELETSKEETQATNEELSTVADELRRQNAQLTQTNDDLFNLLGNVEVAIVILTTQLRIRLLTRTAENLLNLIQADIGRPIRDLNLGMDIPDFERQLTEVLQTGERRTFEARNIHARQHIVRIHPYRTREEKIEGVVLIFIDVDFAKRHEALRERQAHLLAQVREPLLMWELGGRLVYWNEAAEQVYGYTADHALTQAADDLLVRTAPPASELKAALESQRFWHGRTTQCSRTGREIVSDSHMVIVTDSEGRSMVIEAQRLSEGTK